LSTQKDRRDHYLPQGYLRGFVDPAREDEDKPLWKLDIASRKWAERSTKAVGHITGLYDYAGEGPELESLPSADDAFSELENEFPAVRQKLLMLKKKGFRNWTKHLDFLLRYMDMIRARSPLYFAHREAAWKATPTWIVDKVIDEKSFTVKSLEGSPPSDDFIKNRTIFQMREEIQKNGAWLLDFNWALRYTDSLSEPFIAHETPLVVDEVAKGVPESEILQHPASLLYFPVCWQVCLFGSRQRFDRGTGKLDSRDMQVLRRKYRIFAKEFLISPTKLDDITNFCATQPPENSVAASASSE
jgi:hypothetical protein